MSCVNESSKTPIWYSSLCGLGRGLAVQLFIFPFEVVKIRQQCLEHPERCYRVAAHVFKNEGAGAFYKGLKPKLTNICIKQIWAWPMITRVPVFLTEKGVKGLYREALTGFAIATVDAGSSFLMDKNKIQDAHLGKDTFSLKEFISAKSYSKEKWDGFSTHWGRLSVIWTTFLVSQKYLRDRYRKSPEETLTHLQLMSIGVQIAVIGSLASAPFDYVNTRKQAHNCPVSDLFKGNAFRKAFRGAPINAFTMTVQGMASVFLIEKLKE